MTKKESIQREIGKTSQLGWLSRLVGFSICVSSVLMFSTQLAAQDFAGFRGRITDPSNAVVVAAEVKATEEKSGSARTTASNQDGEYELRGILPGTYTIEVSLTGFKKYENKGVIVYARDVRRVDVQLALGEVSSTVEVTEQGSRIQTDTASIQYKTPNKEIYALNISSALIYRIDLNPGAESRSQVHGSFANNTNAEQDGIATNAYGSWRAPQETTQEIQQISLNAPAEYRTSTSIIGIGRKGSNALHGEIFGNLQHPNLNALPLGQTSRPPGTPTWRWSYEVGGPVYIPKVYDGRNKTFFHFLYQPSSGRSSSFHDNFVVPTPKMRTGDMSEYAAFRGITIKNPYTGQPFANNIIPDSMISAVAKNTLKLLPLPNNGPAGSLINNYVFTTFTNAGAKWYHLRFDHQITNSNTISVTHYRFNSFEDDGEGDPLPNGGFNELANTRSWSIQDSHTFSSRLLNEFGFSFNRQHSAWQVGSVPGKDFFTSMLGINPAGRNLAAGFGGPRVVVQTLGNQLGLLAGGYNPFPTQLLAAGNGFVGSVEYTDGHVVQARDNVSYSTGKHLIKTGLEVRQQRPNMNNAITGDTYGRFDYTGAFTGYDFGDLMLGLPFSSGIDAVRSRVEARHWEIGAYIQDDWKVTPKLTLTPGLRFQHYGVPFEKNGIWYNFDVATRKAVVPDERALAQVAKGYPIPVVTAAQAGYPERLRNFKFLLLEPRFGIAWRPLEKTVLRVAYGVYHVPFVNNAAWATANVFGETDRAGVLAGLANGPFQLSERFGPNEIVNGVPRFTSQSPFPTGTIGLSDVYSAPVNGRKDAWPADQQWNVTIERELPWAFSMRASYVGSKGTHWPYYRDLNTVPASKTPFSASRRPFGTTLYNSVNVFELGGNSTHHGMEIEASRQFSKGLYFRAWYGWLKTLNDVQAGLFGSSTGNPIEDPYDRSREKGWQDGTTPIKSRWVGVYDLPFGRGQQFLGNVPGALNHIIGNWTIAPSFVIQSSSRYTPSFSGADPANVGRSGGRPDGISGCNPNGVSGGPGVIWNRSCFVLPPNGRFGDASRGMLAGPTTWNTDFNMFKQWNLTANENGPYFRVEMYSANILNHRNSGGPASTNIANPSFGLFRPGGNRSIYFRLRLGF